MLIARLKYWVTTLVYRFVKKEKSEGHRLKECGDTTGKYRRLPEDNQLGVLEYFGKFWSSNDFTVDKNFLSRENRREEVTEISRTGTTGNSDREKGDYRSWRETFLDLA